MVVCRGSISITVIPFKLNVLLAQAMYVSDLTVALYCANVQYMNLASVAEEIQHRTIHIFSRDDAGRRAVNGGNPKLNRDPHFRDYVHFYEVS